MPRERRREGAGSAPDHAATGIEPASRTAIWVHPATAFGSAFRLAEAVTC